MILDELITDRTQADVDLVKALLASPMTPTERQMFVSGLKGAYNHIDMNRVETAAEYVHDVLLQIVEEIERVRISYGVATDSMFTVGIKMPPMTFEKDWSVYDIITKDEADRYLNNIRILLSQFATDAILPETLDKLTFTGANQIESAIKKEHDAALAEESNILELLSLTKDSFIYSDEFQAGEAML